jgi:hypothetical protein
MAGSQCDSCLWPVLASPSEFRENAGSQPHCLHAAAAGVGMTTTLAKPISATGWSHNREPLTLFPGRLTSFLGIAQGPRTNFRLLPYLRLVFRRIFVVICIYVKGSRPLEKEVFKAGTTRYLTIRTLSESIPNYVACIRTSELPPRPTAGILTLTLGLPFFNGWSSILHRYELFCLFRPIRPRVQMSRLQQCITDQGRIYKAMNL